MPISEMPTGSDRTPIPITTLTTTLPYADGAEQHLLSLMQGATDTSSGSDELARHITDWPTQYHLGNARSNLLRPLRLGPGKRVLDVGSGTGALLRAIAESGAEAFGLEGSYDRCLVASERLRGMSNAHIICGSLEDYAERRPETAPSSFDIIVVCGVLEYSGSTMGGDAGPAKMLQQLAGLLAPGGVIALAIENQWGLKYLCSYPEDHLDLPWIGLEGYWRSESGVRTWSRKQLEQLFEGAGLAVNRWFAALPDYKLPTLLIAGEMFEDEAGRALVKQFVRSPLSRPGDFVTAADPVLVFQSAVDAGLGMETANSFLAMITKESDDTANVDDGLLWLCTSDRTRIWRSVRKLVKDEAAGGYTLRLQSGQPAAVGPLICDRPPVESVVVGQNVEDLIRRAYVQKGADSSEARSLLSKWALLATEHLSPNEDGRVRFDVMANNFIVDAEGRWHMVDTEFSWAAPESVEVFLYRALWFTAERLSESGSVPQQGLSVTRHELTRDLAVSAGLDLPGDIAERWAIFEAELNAALFSWSPERKAAFPEHLGQLGAAPAMPVERATALGLIERLQQSEGSLTTLAQTMAQLGSTQFELGRTSLLLEVAYGQIRDLRGQLRMLESSTSWRVTEPLRRVRGGGR